MTTSGMVQSGTAWLVVRQGSTPAVTVGLLDELTVGREVGLPEVEGHLALSGDPSISRLHAILIWKAIGWCLQAPQATNGLFVNGTRLADGAVHLLTTGDEIRIGQHTTLAFHALDPTAPDRSRTQTALPPPELTSAERRVLLCLCLPLMEGDAFTPPANVSVVAQLLFVTESAVKQHLGRLYQKFGTDDGKNRRVRLANEALQRGVIRRSDLEAFRNSHPSI